MPGFGMDPGFWSHAGRREEPWGEIPRLVLHGHRFVLAFLLCIQESEPAWEKWKKNPSGCAQENRGSAEAFPLFQENIANFTQEEEGIQGEKSIYSPGILCFPDFPHLRGFLGCRGFHHREIFLIWRFLGCSDLELSPNPFNSNLFQGKQRRRFGSVNRGQGEKLGLGWVEAQL